MLSWNNFTLSIRSQYAFSVSKLCLLSSKCHNTGSWFLDEGGQEGIFSIWNWALLLEAEPTDPTNIIFPFLTGWQLSWLNKLYSRGLLSQKLVIYQWHIKYIYFSSSTMTTVVHLWHCSLGSAGFHQSWHQGKNSSQNIAAASAQCSCFDLSFLTPYTNKY